MVRLSLGISLLVGMLIMEAAAQEKFETDVIKTSAGNLEITFIGHGTLMFTFGGKVIHVDPWTQMADYSKLPKADLILITHEHRDHLDLKAIEILRKDQTVIVCPKISAEQIKGASVMINGDVKTIEGLTISRRCLPTTLFINATPVNPFTRKGMEMVT